MRVNNKVRFMPIILTLLLIIMMLVPMTQSAAYDSPTAVNLGTAASFGVLAGSTITNTGSTIVRGTAGGNIGLYPGTSFTGQASVTRSGTVHINDNVAIQAKADLLTAYNNAVARLSNETIIATADLGGRTLAPGVYTSASSIGLTGTLILDGGGDPNAVFIFQAGSTLTTASNSRIELINGAQACHVFWQVGSSATLGTNSTFVGHIIAFTSITANTGAVVQGQLLALNGAVTLDANTITNDLCFGSLSVTKVVSGETSEITMPLFEITVTGPGGFTATRTFVNGESFIWENLVPGVYTVTESRTGLSSEWTVSGEGTVQVISDQTSLTTITNAYIADEVEPPLGALSVAKVVSGETGDITMPLFEITVTGPGGFTATRTFVNGESFIWENLVPGVYTVTESRTGLSSEWTVSGEGTVQVIPDQTSLTTITNAYIADEVEPSLGDLTVAKVVSGYTGDITMPLFEMTVRGPEGFSATRTFVHGESFTWANLVPGVYTVTESRTGLSSEWTISGEGTVQVVADQTALTTITNAYIADEVEPSNDSEDETSNGSVEEPSFGALTVTKVVSGEIGDMTLPVYGITVTGQEGFSAIRTFVHGESFTWVNLVPGVYTVTENKTGLRSEWTVSGEGTLQVTADQTALTTITNAYIVNEVLSSNGLETEPSNGSEDETSNGSVVRESDSSEDELVVTDQPDVTTTTNGFEETAVLGIVELPKTGGYDLLMIYSGLLLFGLGLFMRPKGQ